MKTASKKNKLLMNEVLPGLLVGRDMPNSSASRLFEALFSGDLNDTQAKSVLLLLARKGESSDELWGAVSALRKLEKPIGPRIRGLMDTCGTGGDKSQSINLSTLAALTAAGAGAKIAKHGNRAISSRSGSSDLMEAFGVRINAKPSRMFKAIRKAGIGYFHAPYYHPVFARLQPLRKSLKRRTLLNLLGPLVNPMRLDFQLVGVAEKRLLTLYAKVLAKLGRRSALVCHSADGMDEISTSKPTQVVWIRSGKISASTINPCKLGLKRATQRDLRAPSPKKSQQIARNILNGKEKGPKRDAVILNAAYALLVGKKARTLAEAVQMARNSIATGNALKTLTKLKKISTKS